MDDTANVLLALCGLGVVCGGGVLLLAFSLLRIGRGGFLAAIASALTMFFGDRGYDDAADNTYPTGTDRSRRHSLQARIDAANYEFDRVLHQDDHTRNRPFASGPRPDLPPSRPQWPDRPVDYTGQDYRESSLRNRRGRPRRDTRHNEQNEDEIFGGMFDE